MPTYAEMEGSARLSEVTYRVNKCSFTRNKGGIRGDHNHVEFSNNVWHWEMSDNRFEDNNGGVEFELPLVGRGYSWKDKDLTWYVPKTPVNNRPTDNWQDPRRFHLFWVHNHTFHMNRTNFVQNTDFMFRLGGYYTNTSLTSNMFIKNICQKGLMMITGMEKEMIISDNTFDQNTCKFMLDYDVRSHYEYAVSVKGKIERNSLKSNTPPIQYKEATPDQSDSVVTYSMAVRGVQFVTVNRNLLANSMQYEFVAGLTLAWLADLAHVLNVEYNYWGTTSQSAVRQKIFDFDNWNSYAWADYYPFLIEDKFNSPITADPPLTSQVDINKPLGGRVNTNLILPYRAQPYIVERDLTVMPGYRLKVEPGVTFRIKPNVGILILGQMSAIATLQSPIRFLPYHDQDMTWQRKKRATMGDKTQRSKRAAMDDKALALEKRSLMPMHIYRNADKRLIGGTNAKEGFVQFFNVTAHRWELMCDYQFSWQVGRAVCKDLGYDYNNVVIRFTKYYDYQIYGHDKDSIKFYWRTSFYCEGDEESLNDCVHRINYQLERCIAAKDYVYLRCEKSKLKPGQKFWGNIRFASTESEYKQVLPASEMRHVQIIGAGILHNEHVAAIQSTYLAPTLTFMDIQFCAQNGIDYISPWYSFRVANSSFTDNVGHGIGVVVLNGETSDKGNAIVPLRENTIPQRTFGMVRMCDSSKEIFVTSRILVYYKYSFAQSSCVKVFRSKVSRKQVAFRFLQLDLYHDNFSRNAIEIFDGDQFANASTRIGEIFPNSSQEMRTKMYVTSKFTYSLSVHVHASAAKDNYGFIAEIVTLPLNLIAYPPREPTQYNIFGDIRHTENQAGFIKYRGVGQNNPDIEISRCLIRNNGIQILNLTAPSMIDLFIQNNARLNIINNFISYNKGGAITLYTYANQYERALWANITTNVIDGNTHGAPIHLEGSRYQRITFAYNYIGHNNVEHRNVMAVFGIGMNMTNNTVFSNVGSTVWNVSSEKEVGVYQFYTFNYLYRNKAIGPYHTTIFTNSSRQKFTNNYFFNEQNDLEMATTNRTRLPPRNDANIEPKYDAAGRLLPTPEPPLDDSRVEAQFNWWGSDLVYYVAGRVRDFKQDRYLVNVQWDPYYPYNSSVLEGYCSPGWTKFEHRCFMYMGGALPAADARAQCMHEEAKLADSNKAFGFLPHFIKLTQPHYDLHITRVWVDYTGLAGPNSPCKVIRHVWLETFDCDALLPFICEQEPIPHTQVPWIPIIIALVCVGFAIIVICLLIICMKVKSRRRERERFDRRNSVRASIRSNSRMGSRASLGSMSGRSTRATSRAPRSLAYTLSGNTLDQTSTDSIDKKGLPPSLGSTPAHSLHDLTDSRNGSVANTFTTDREHHAPRLENEIANIRSRPMYDTVFENRGYDDHSLERKRPKKPFDQDSETNSRSSTGTFKPDRNGSVSTIQTVDTSPGIVRKVKRDSPVPSESPEMNRRPRPSEPRTDLYSSIPSLNDSPGSVRKPRPDPNTSIPSISESPKMIRRPQQPAARPDPRPSIPSMDESPKMIRRPPPRPAPEPYPSLNQSPGMIRRPDPYASVPPPAPDHLPTVNQSPRMVRRPRPDPTGSLPSLDRSPGARRRPQQSLGSSMESITRPPRKETEF